MNERSKKLADQAQYYAEYTTPQGLEWLPAFKERFFKVMTKEFIGLLEYEIAMLEKYKSTSCNESDRRWHEGKIVHFRRMIDKTKGHFGVEE